MLRIERTKAQVWCWVRLWTIIKVLSVLNCQWSRLGNVYSSVSRKDTAKAPDPALLEYLVGEFHAQWLVALSADLSEALVDYTWTAEFPLPIKHYYVLCRLEHQGIGQKKKPYFLCQSSVGKSLAP